jgi:hypothetical protein
VNEIDEALLRIQANPYAEGVEMVGLRRGRAEVLRLRVVLRVLSSNLRACSEDL